ncbi:MAG: DUF1566 domain-containing protein [Dissulfurispiraceae bacterium]
MRANKSSLIKAVLACLLLLSFVSVVHAAGSKRFTLKGGVIYDSSTGLQWAPAPNDAGYVMPNQRKAANKSLMRKMNYHQADEYARNLNLAGGGWRLPTIEELKSLYDTTKPGNVDPVFNIIKNWAWTSESRGTGTMDAWAFCFDGSGCGGDGTGGHGVNIYRAGIFPVLAVRSRK